jgi:hypothetical protein
MAQLVYPASLVNASSQVVVPNEDLRTYISAGYLLYVEGESMPYYVAATPTFLYPDTTITLTAPYAGTTATKTITVVSDYTVPDGIPLIYPGDVHTASIVSEALKKLQALLASVGAGYALQKASNLSDLQNAATARTNLGIGNVENKSSATIRGELTSGDVTAALGYTPWHVGNDGAGSTLDADLLDGQQGAYYQNASNLNAGTVATARLGSGTATSATFLTGTNVWRALISGDVTSALGYTPMNPAGAVMTGPLTMQTGVQIIQADEWGTKWQLSGASDYIALNQANTSWDFVRAAGTVDKWRFIDGANTRLQIDANGIILNSLVKLINESSGVLGQRDGNVNQEFRLYNRYDGVGGVDQERISVGSNDTEGYLYTTQAGAGATRKLKVGTTGLSDFEILTNALLRWSVDSTGQLIPGVDNSYDVGSSSKRVRKGYFATAELGASIATSLTTDALTVNAENAATGEGGQIILQKASNGGTTLAGNVYFDVNNNRVRFWEGAGTFRGGYLDLTTMGANAASKIWHSENDGTGSGLDADTWRGLTPAAFVGAASPTFTGTVTADKIDASRITEAFHDYGTLASNGIVTIEVDKYGHAAFTAPVDTTANFTIALSGIPASGKSQTVLIEMINGQRAGSGTINYPVNAYWMAGGLPPPNNALASSGRNFFTVTFRDGGTRQEWAFSGVSNLTGDVTSVGNATTIPANSLTAAKLFQVATSTLLGRSTAGTGNIEVLTLGTGLSISGGAVSVTGTNPVTDDNATATAVYPLWAAGASGNQAQKISSTKLSFVPSTGTLTATTFSGAFSGSGAALTSIPNAALVNSNVTIGTTAISLGGTSTSLAGLTAVTATTFTGNLVGNVTGTLTGNITGNAATVTTNANLTGPVTSVGNATSITANAVALSHMAQVATGVLLGRSTAGTGNVETITLGTGLQFSGGALNVTVGGGTVTTVGVTANNGITQSVANPTTTPQITLGLGNITPTSVTAAGVLDGWRVLERFNDYGAVAGGGTVTIEVDKYGHVAFTAPAQSSSFTIALSGIAAAGKTQTIVIEMINGFRQQGQTITFPAAAQFMGGKPSDQFYESNGRNFFTVTIRDGGARQEWSIGTPDIYAWMGWLNETNTAVGNPHPMFYAMRQGKRLFNDEEFATGVNSVAAYNNAGNGVVTVTRTNAISGVPNSTGYCLEVRHTDNTATPGFGGVMQIVNSALNKRFVQMFRAKLPAGYKFVYASNSVGTNGANYFLTSDAGTGKWETYIRVVESGDSGSFSSSGHIYVTGSPAPSPGVNLVWWIASMTAFELDSLTGGSGSGLNADFLDGLDSTAFPTLAGANNFTNDQTISGGKFLLYTTSGVAPPSFTTRSAGTRVMLYPNIGASSADYAIGIDGSTLWNSVPTTASQFRWYGGTTLAATLSGAGALTLVGGLSATTIAASSTLTAAGATITGTTKINNLDFTSIIPVFGQRQIRLNELCDVLYHADKRFTVTNVTGNLGSAALFDGGFDGPVQLTTSTTHVMNISMANQSGVPAAGITYPQGTLYVSFYSTNNAYVAISARGKYNGSWTAWAAPTDISTIGSYKVMAFAVTGANYLTDIELTIQTDGTNLVWVTALNYLCDRWTSELELPFVSKYMTNNALFGNFDVKTNTGTAQNRLSGTGTSYLVAAAGNLLVGTTTDTASAGKIQLPAATGAANGIYFGSTSANLYQSAAGTLKTDGALIVTGGITGTASNASQLGGVAAASYALLASPTFTGVPAAPTAAVDTNTTQLATTAYVVGQGYLKSASAAATYAPLASPTFTGTVTAGNLSIISASNGSISMQYGDATRPGYIGFFTPDATRRGYVGWKSGGGNYVAIVGENGWGWALETAFFQYAGTTGLGIAPSSSAQLTLPAGTTALAPVRITHGVAPTTPADGDIWTTTAGMYARINGVTVGPFGTAGGATVTTSTTPPGSPAAGDLWWNSEEGNLYVWYSDGTSNQWVAASLAPPVDAVIVSATAPGNPAAGALWWNSENGNLYIYYNDGTSSQWVSATPGPEPVAGRNLIIGGDFTTNPWQRGTSFAAAANGAYTADRWQFGASNAGAVTIAKTADAPTVVQAGVYSTHCLHVDVTTADASLAAGDYAFLSYKVEGLDSAFLGFGQSVTRDITLSFWVKATKTGVYCVFFRNSAANRTIVKEYTVSSSNVWEKKTVTIPVDTTGTWLYDTGIGLWLGWTLMAGTTYQGTGDTWAANAILATANQVNALDSTANDFKIQLVQLEAGPVATPFDVVDVEMVTARCQRYYEQHDGTNSDGLISGDVTNGGQYYSIGFFLVAKRAAPTMTYYYTGNSGHFPASAPTANVTTKRSWRCYATANGTAAGGYLVYYWTADAEL